MGALLVSLAVAGILMSAALPVWSQAARREREAELAFRGEQYARAVQLYQRTYAGAFPPDVETLLEERFLRRPYRDPMVEDGEFRILYESDMEELPGAPATMEQPGEIAAAPPPAVTAAGGRERSSDESGGIVGVVSRSDAPSLRIYNGATRYSQWVFLHTAAADAPGRTASAGPTEDAAPGRIERQPRTARPGQRGAGLRGPR